MKWLLLLALIVCLPQIGRSEPVKTMSNPFTNKQDYITRIDSNTIIPGTNVTVTSHSNGTVTINASGGGGTGTACGVNPVGLQFADSDGCTWCTTVATAGNLVTTFQSCPTPPVPFTGTCHPGEPIGLTLLFTCS